MTCLFINMNACFCDKLGDVGAVVASRLVEQALDSDGKILLPVRSARCWLTSDQEMTRV